MDKDIIQKFNNLKLIKPEKDFVKKCRNEVLSFKPYNYKRKIFFFNWPALVWSGSFVAIFLIGATTLLYSNLDKQTFTAFENGDKLTGEFNGLAVNSQFKETKNQQNINQTITSALNEISDTNTKHLNSSLLQKERNNLNSLNGEDDKKIDKLLNSVIF